MTMQNIAIIGADNSEIFLKEMLLLKERGINIVGVYSAKGTLLNKIAQEQGLKQLNVEEIVELGEKLDVIFDLSGDPQIRMELRKTLFSSDNKHTVIAPESVAQVMWAMMGREGLPSSGVIGY
ncbi:MAG: homoserine dehydrogenase [Gammaproteobacteria bacterium]|nr:homoserine dehydrogenase [Gammaproteobacteria bacterium]